MASTYTTDLAIQLMATGENAGTWGQITNTNLVVIQQAIAGYQAISIAGTAQTTALLMTQNAVSTARNAVIKLTGTITGAQIVTIPNGIEKTWIVSNGTVGASTVTFKYASTGTGQTWSATDKGIKILYADGSDIQVADLSTLSGSIVAAQITNSTITQAKLAANSVGTNQLQTNAVTAIKITQSTITQSKLAANSVGANQLISTGVTAATYTAATITVDADGRITSASSGSGGAGGFVPTLIAIGPGTGTYTSAPTANRIMAYGYGGTGGSGGHVTGYENHGSGGSGGLGGLGYYNIPISQPYSRPYSLGGNGNPGNNIPYNGTAPAGNAGGSTTLGPGGSVFSIGGGAGGNGASVNSPGNQGSTGTATPSGSLTIPSSNRNFYVGGTFGDGGVGKIVIFENTGT